MKGKILGALLTIFVTGLLIVVGMDNRTTGDPYEVYQVYLNGKKLGLIKSEAALLDLIDKEQSSIKETFNVDKVYPPTGLNIEKVYTYNDKINNTEDIYNQIKNQEPFTVQGYMVTITYNKNEDSEETKEPLKIYLLDDDLIKKALYNVAKAFIGEDELDSYDKGTQTEITELGEIINSVYFGESITIKEALISTKQKIFSTEDELTQYLLFGTTEQSNKYVVNDGEDLNTIANNHQLNISELLIANPKYPSGSALLTAGEELNVSLINPLVSVTYRKTVVSNVDVPYKTEYTTDDSKYVDYRQVTTPGVKGISRVTQDIKYVNGEVQSLNITQSEVIKEPVTEIVAKGTKKIGTFINYNSQSFSTGDYSWPTNSPFIITSRFEYRWGTFHKGIDISGTGYKSPIYSIADGEVYSTGYGSSEGNYVVIKHSDSLYSQYMHLAAIYVKKGQQVSRTQKIGAMGSTGFSTGVHLHLGIWLDAPPYQQGSVVVDPCKSVFRC